MNKKLIRLTESDLHRIVSELVNERIESEKGMTDSQVKDRRRSNFIKDMNALNDDPYSPSYGDYLDMEEPFVGQDEIDFRVDRDRLARHRAMSGHEEPFESLSRHGRLTESRLKRIVRESVCRILDEGQGWNIFKDRAKGILRGEYDNDLDQLETDDGKKEIQNFIKHGNASGFDDDYYDEYGDSHPNNQTRRYKPMNKGLSGRLGRRAAVNGIQAVAGGRALYNKLRNKKG